MKLHWASLGLVEPTLVGVAETAHALVYREQSWACLTMALVAELAKGLLDILAKLTAKEHVDWVGELATVLLVEKRMVSLKIQLD